jgi:hypothetical protein
MENSRGCTPFADTHVPSGKHTKNIKKLWKITIFYGKSAIINGHFP